MAALPPSLLLPNPSIVFSSGLIEFRVSFSQCRCEDIKVRVKEVLHSYGTFLKDLACTRSWLHLTVPTEVNVFCASSELYWIVKVMEGTDKKSKLTTTSYVTFNKHTCHDRNLFPPVTLPQTQTSLNASSIYFPFMLPLCHRLDAWLDGQSSQQSWESFRILHSAATVLSCTVHHWQ